MNRKVKNCPFCGSENLLIGGDYIECQLCGVVVSSDRIDNDNQNSIVDIWNRRSVIEAGRAIGAWNRRADDGHKNAD